MGNIARYNQWIEPFHQPVLIYNPAAGKLRRNPPLLQRTIAALARAGIQPRLLPTQQAGHADQLAADAIAQGADLVLAFGGDGTINEVVQGVAHTGVTMGVIPGGTANVLARELGLASRVGTSVEKAVERLAACRPIDIALGKITLQSAPRRYFLLMVGAGLDATVVYDVHADLKAATGKLAYWVAGFAQIRRRVGQLEISANGTCKRGGFLLISRVRNYGGDLEIATGASLLRPDFQAVLFEGSHPLRYVAYMLGVSAKQVARLPGVHCFHTNRIELLTPAPVQADGEFLGRSRAVIEIQPAALKLLIPATYR